VRSHESAAGRLPVSEVKHEAVERAVYAYGVVYGRADAVVGAADLHFYLGVDARSVVKAGGLLLELGYVVFQAQYVGLGVDDGVHELVVVFGYDESPDPSAGRVESRGLAPQVPGATLELEHLPIPVFLNGVVVEKLARYVRESIVRPQLWTACPDGLYLDFLLPRGVLRHGLGLAGVVHQVQSPVRVEGEGKRRNRRVSNSH
jgi:hypothetical protein